MTVTFITGGARSGKSAFAEERALLHGGTPVMIATAEAGDEEMSARIARHRAGRGEGWTTLEEPVDLPEALAASDGAGARVVDCLTLWLSNLMARGRDWEAASLRLVAALGEQRAPVILVSNEVGQGIVPANALARAFRDAAGIVNRRVAAAADEAFLIVAGLPLRLKG